MEREYEFLERALGWHKTIISLSRCFPNADFRPPPSLSASVLATPQIPLARIPQRPLSFQRSAGCSSLYPSGFWSSPSVTASTDLDNRLPQTLPPALVLTAEDDARLRNQAPLHTQHPQFAPCIQEQVKTIC